MIQDKLVSLLINESDLQTLKSRRVNDVMADGLVINCQAEDCRLDISLDMVGTGHFKLFVCQALST
jgi:hypothetical protein